MAEYSVTFMNVVGGAPLQLRDWRTLDVRRRQNAAGELRLELPRAELPGLRLVRDARLEVIRDGRRLLDGFWLLRWVERFERDGERLYRLHFVDQISILDNPIIAYPAGTSYTSKSGKADDLIKQFARENLGSLATDPARNLSAYISIEANTGQGAQTYKVATKRRLLGVCQDLARASTQLGTPLFFDLVPQGTNTLALRTFARWRGADHRSGAAVPVVLSPELATMDTAERSEDYRFDFSVVYASGQGAGSQRVTVTTSDAARLVASPWARKERFVDARNLKTLDALNSTAAATLLQGRPALLITGVVRDRPGCIFGVHWGFGDLVDASVDGVVASCRVEQVTVEATPDAETVSVELLDMAAEASAGLSIAQQLEELGTSDAATIGTVPEPWGVPQADARRHAGKWLAVGDIGAGSGQAGRVAFYGSSSLDGDSGLVWDTTNKRLGVGTSSPAGQLTIVDENARAARGLYISEHQNTIAGATVAAMAREPGHGGGSAGVCNQM